VHPEQLKAPAHISEGKIIASTAELVETLEDAAERSSSPGRACRPGGRKASDRRETALTRSAKRPPALAPAAVPSVAAH